MKLELMYLKLTGAQEALAHRFTFRGVVVAIFIEHGAVGGALVDELRRQNIAGGDPLVVAELVFIDHPEAVSRLQVLGKVDVPAEDGGQVHDLIFGHPRIHRGAPEAGADLALAHLFAGVEGDLDVASDKGLLLAAHLERLLQTVGVIEAVQLAVLGELEGELLPRLQHAQGIAALELVDQVQIRGAQANALEDHPHVVATAHLHLLGDVARLGRGNGLGGFGSQLVVQRVIVSRFPQGNLVAVFIDPCCYCLFAWPGSQHHDHDAQDQHHLAVPVGECVEGVPNNHEKQMKSGRIDGFYSLSNWPAIPVICLALWNRDGESKNVPARGGASRDQARSGRNSG